MRRRTTTVGAVAALAAFGLTACGAGGSTGGPLDSTGPIDIWYSNNEQELAWGQQMVEAWNAEHPDEQITAQEIPAGRSSEEVLGAAIAAGTAPCLVFNTAPAAVGQFAKQGGLLDLTRFEGGAEYIEERSGDLAAQYASADGAYFQLPWKSNPVQIFYNRELFAEAGLDPDEPRLATYDEFLDTARTLVESGAAPYAIWPAPTSEFFQIQFDFLPLYAAETGGAPLLDGDASTFASDEGAAVAEFWHTLYTEGLAGQEKYTGDAFADGQAAMSIVGPWAISVYEDVDWGSVPVPTSGGMPTDEIWTFSDAKNIGLYRACDHPATAWEVLKFATSEEQDGLFLELTGQMPLREGLAETYADYFAANPDYVAFGEQAARVVEVPTSPNTVAMLQALRDAWSGAVIFGGPDADVRAALDDAAVKFDDLARQP